MDVEVHHRLADVHADVVAVGVEPAVEEGYFLPGEGGGLFCGRAGGKKEA